MELGPPFWGGLTVRFPESSDVGKRTVVNTRFAAVFFDTWLAAQKIQNTQAVQKW
jgi:hypothetical protein